MRNIGEAKKDKGEKKNDVEGRVCALERLVGKAIKWMEEVHGADIDQDGKIGNMRIALAVFLVACIAGFTFAVTQDIANWSQDSGLTGTAKITHDGTGYLFTADNCTISGTLTAGTIAGSTPVFPTTADATTTIALTSADYGTTTLVSSNAAVAVTLPANGAAVGSWLEVAVIGSDACAPTISAATADTLIGPNDIDLDSVTWATGHRINALARFWSDGSFWHVQNLGGTTMTYTD